MTDTRRVAILAPMRPELKAVVRSGKLEKSTGDPVLPYRGAIGQWSVSAGLIGIGPAPAGAATKRVLTRGSFDHVMVVGIAGGLDPTLTIGSLLVPSRVRLYPDGPEFVSQPLSPRVAEGALMTTDGLFSDEAVWRPILEDGFSAVDMEASAVAEVCAAAGISWSVYRGISDRPDEQLVGQAVFGLSKPDGSADMSAVARYVARDPRRVMALAHLNRAMELAASVAADAAVGDLRMAD